MLCYMNLTLGADDGDESLDLGVTLLSAEIHSSSQTSESEHFLYRKAKEDLVFLYEKTSEVDKKESARTYDWLVDRFMETVDFSKNWKIVTTNQSTKRFIVPGGETFCSLHPAISSIIEHQSEQLSGLEIVLAIILQHNPVVLRFLQKAIRHNTFLDYKQIDEMSLGNARNSVRGGVYGLKFNDGSIIIGHALSNGFKGRLDGRLYSEATKVVNAVGPGIDDQRRKRMDYILFDVDEVAVTSTGLRWLAMAIETLFIVMFGSTRPGYGLNSRSADPGAQFGGLSVSQVIEVWRKVKEVTDSGEVIPPLKIHRNAHRSDSFQTWCTKYNLKEMLPKRIFILIRSISPIADSGQFSAFPPLRKGAWLLSGPRQRGKGVTIYSATRTTVFKSPAADRNRCIDDYGLNLITNVLDVSDIAKRLLARYPSETIEEPVKKTVSGNKLSRKIKSTKKDVPATQEEAEEYEDDEMEFDMD
ncbi:uncharacterized protein L201_000218 [Kwoniella dendrophila CBS 6074]|uniref:Uncharacterized protein n=1 Tax=Kwoniella dendrophila CBS 6074 TaxID=1295534 RepID=A0AAX4JLE1_9TREE